ncbi:hypothetical protein NS226_16820 [Aureimonas ureilytica]|uniref:Uncharacterized protein n=1 Tax=Aureimonas ureilytica TaxID=401562 RepID=A0A175R5H4_9HYPH|nr:hypothetical protein [Aureimonas ureilytica]KTQ89471.1 hypothetical protein NS226_16820 [Aureimonas ureilytica]
MLDDLVWIFILACLAAWPVWYTIKEARYKKRSDQLLRSLNEWKAQQIKEEKEKSARVKEANARMERGMSQERHDFLKKNFPALYVEAYPNSDFARELPKVIAAHKALPSVEAEFLRGLAMHRVNRSFMADGRTDAYDAEFVAAFRRSAPAKIEVLRYSENREIRALIG